MKRASAVVLVVLLLASCASGGGDLSKAETQRRFGVRMAKMDLWREAMFRFKRASEIEPDNAMARNNLAVAYEATGDFDAAAREYREALRLDRGNTYIQKNYSRFVEFTQRSRKREAKPAEVAPPAPPASAQPGDTTTTPAAAPPAPAEAVPPPPPTTAPPEPATANPPQESGS